MPRDPHILAHQEWLGYVQPVGLVVSIPALLHVQAGVDRNIIPEHQKFIAAVAPAEKPAIRDFPAFCQTILSWGETDLVGRPGGDPVPTTLEVALPEYGETLRATYAGPDSQPSDPAR